VTDVCTVLYITNFQAVCHTKSPRRFDPPDLEVFGRLRTRQPPPVCDTSKTLIVSQTAHTSTNIGRSQQNETLDQRQSDCMHGVRFQ
jgi:hypothetical protein